MIISIGLALGVSASLLYVFLLQPFILKLEANKKLSDLGSPRDSVVASNTEVFDYDGENPLQLNTDQKGLGSAEITEPASLNFGKNGRTVEVWADLGSQAGRDFFLVNQTILETMLKSRKINLQIHPVIGKDPYGMYSAEALSESFVLNPDKSWEFFLEVLKNGAEVETRDDILNSITNIATKLGINIDAASINNGTFVSWLMTADEGLQHKQLPYILIDGEPVPDGISIMNPEEFKKII